MGTLDGAGISYLRRESDEMAYLEDMDPAKNGGKYPTFAIDKVNHAQVSSGIAESNNPTLIITLCWFLANTL